MHEHHPEQWPRTLDEIAGYVEDLPDGLARGLILPLPAGAIPIEGALGLPAVARKMAIDPTTGLALPFVERTMPLDLVDTYVSPRHHLGFEIQLETIRDTLQGLPLKNVLWTLAQVAQRVDRSSGTSDQVELANHLLPPEFIALVSSWLQSEGEVRAVTSTQVVLKLALLATQGCNPDLTDDQEVNQPLIRLLGLLLLGLADHMVAYEKPTREALALELARNELFFRLQGYLEWYTEAFYLLFEVLPGLTASPDWFDVDAVVSSAYGVSLGDLWCCTALLGIASLDQAMPLRIVPGWSRDFTIDHTIVDAVVDVWSTDLAHVIELARVDLDTTSDWSFNAFRAKPIIRYDQHAHTVRSHYLAEKAGPTGMFWVVRDALPDSIEYEQWARLFGKAIEARTLALLNEHVGDPTRLLDEAVLRDIWGEGKVADSLVIYPDSWVIFEFVYRSVSRSAQVDGTYDDLATEIERAVLEKLDQVDDMLRRSMAGGTVTEARQIISVVVIGSAFPSNPLIARIVSDAVASGRYAVLGGDPRCLAPRVMDVFEFRTLLNVAQREGATIEKLLREWSASDFSTSSLRTWLATRRGPSPDWFLDAVWRERMIARVFGGSPAF